MLFFRWYEKTSRVTLNFSLFMGMCIYLKVKLIFGSIEYIHRSPKQKHLCLVLGPGMTQTVGSHSSWFELRKLGTCVFSVVSSVGAVWEVHAYINENNTHRSETKITDKCFKILFLIFIHYIPHKKCINNGIKYRRHDKKLTCCTTVLDV